MKLIINGDPTDYDGDQTLAALLASLDADPDRVATMVNNTVVKQDARDTTTLNEGDAIEVLSFAGGG